MKIKSHIIYIAIIFVLIVLLIKPFTKSDEVNRGDSSTIDTLSFVRDTITIVEYDTLIQERVVYKDRYVIDTIFFRDSTNNTNIQLPLVQKYYNVPNSYELWISGIEPLNVDKINVFNQVEYRTITNTITQNVYSQSTQFYFGGGFYTISSTFAPIVGISLKTKKNVLITLDYGRYEKNNMFLVSAKFKILGK